MPIDLRQMRYFVAVAEVLHFRKAAEKLGVAQPALSRTIRNLEDELGAMLFVRTNRNVRITEAGKTFLEGCRKVEKTVECTIEEIRRVRDGKLGSLAVGYTDAALSGRLPYLMQGFLRQEPGIHLQPLHGVTGTQLKMLEQEELDVGFVTGPLNLKGYEHCPIQSEDFVCVVHDQHPLAKRKEIRLIELADEDFVLGISSEWEHFLSYLLPMCRRAGFVPRIVHEALFSDGILGLVACGMGVTVLTSEVSKRPRHGISVIPSLMLKNGCKPWRSGSPTQWRGPRSALWNF